MYKILCKQKDSRGQQSRLLTGDSELYPSSCAIKWYGNHGSKHVSFYKVGMQSLNPDLYLDFTIFESMLRVPSDSWLRKLLDLEVYKI